MNVHINSVHEGLKFSCSFCDKKFTQMTNMNKHVENLHNFSNEKEIYQCKFENCTYKGTKDNMNQHNHNAKKTYNCKSCDYITSSSSNLIKHSRAVHEKISKRIKECHICHQTFTQNSHLNDHISSVHNKKKPFQCTTC